MRINQFFFGSSLFLLFLGLIILFLSHDNQQTKDSGETAFTTSDRKRQSTTAPSARRLSESSKKIDHSKQNQLERLKDRWEGYVQIKESLSDEERSNLLDSLSKETAETLLTSVQMIDLLTYLDKNKIKDGARWVRRKTEDIFKGENSDTIFKSLLNTISNHAHEIKEGPYKIEFLGWSYLMGQAARPEQFDVFLGQIEDEWHRGDFVYGWAVKNGKDDPEATFSMLVDFIKDGGKGVRQDQSLEDLVESFPAGAELDFEKLEASLPPPSSAPESRSFENARRALLMEWANSEPAEAVNHIIGNPERISPVVVNYIVGEAINANRLGFDGIEWVNQFPPGPYYDQAAAAVVRRLERFHPEEARQWAASIGNAELRERQFEYMRGRAALRARKEGNE